MGFDLGNGGRKIVWTVACAVVLALGCGSEDKAADASDGAASCPETAAGEVAAAPDAAADTGTDAGAAEVKDASADAPPQEVAAEVAEDVPPPDVQPPDVPPADVAPPAPVCGNCHAEKANKLAQGPHAKIATGCIACHDNGMQHQADPKGVPAKIEFRLDACGKCHSGHETAYLKDDGKKAGKYGGSAKTSKYDEFPHYKYLMGGHGFTKEYNEERAHKFMLKDHVDIARKQNAVCLQCKSTPVAYYWGEKRRGVDMFNKGQSWADIVAKLKAEQPAAMEYGAACNHCHDPHLGGYRVIRKAMIAAILERGTDPYNAKFNVVPKTAAELEGKLNERDPATGKLTSAARRLAGTLTCAQCHVEYTCGPGADSAATGILRDDFPWRKLKDLESYYQAKFDLWQDWKHSVTGTNGIKAQHPETEFFWGSKHYELGLGCTDCHMAQGAAQPKLDTPAKDHWLTSPQKQVAGTCGKCHGDGASDKLKEVQQKQDEFWKKSQETELALKDTLEQIEAAQKAGGAVTEALAQASALYLRALLWWEFTAVSENSTGAHNPAEGITNLTKSGEFAAQAKLALKPK